MTAKIRAMEILTWFGESSCPNLDKYSFAVFLYHCYLEASGKVAWKHGWGQAGYTASLGSLQKTDPWCPP